MKEKEITTLLKKLKKLAPDVHETFLRAALTEVQYKDYDNIQQYMDEVVKISRKLKSQYAQEETPWSVLTFTDLITSDELLEMIKPKVEEIRMKGFNTTNPPFKTIEDAAKWIEQQTENDKNAFIASFGKEKWDELTGQLQKLALECGFKLQRPTLPYPKANDGWVYRVVVWPKTYLTYLAHETKLLAKATGFHQAAVVAHVLTGIKVYRPRARISTTINSYTLPNGKQLVNEYATVQYLAADFSFEETRQLHAKLKEMLGLKKQKTIDAKAWRIYQLVKENGGPPAKNKVAFWQHIQQLWNATADDADKFTTWNGVKKAYFDAVKKIQCNLLGSKMVKPLNENILS